MTPAETVILRDPWDVQLRLDEIGAHIAGLLRVIDFARGEAANQTPFHNRNFAGTIAYQYGSYHLRQEFVPQGWVVDRPCGVEAILNNKSRVRIVFANVDVCCNDFHQPKARSDKGSGAERVCSGNLFETLPHYTVVSRPGETTFYLMCGDNDAAELSRPIIKNKRFFGYLERLYLSSGKGSRVDLPDFGSEDAVLGFDPEVTRK